MQNISQHALKSLSCFAAVTFYSTSQMCIDECFLHDRTMSVFYFLSIIAKPLFFLLIGYMDEQENLTRRMILLKMKSIILIILFWNILFFFIDSVLFRQGYLLQNEILIAIATIYLFYPLLIRVLQSIALTLFLVGLFVFFSLLVNFYNALGKGYTIIDLPEYFNVWILISYYLFGRILGSKKGQRLCKRTLIAIGTRVLLIPAALMLFFYEYHLTFHAVQNIIPWFLIEQLLVLLLCLILFVLFDNLNITNPWIVKIVTFISPAMMGVYIVHYSVFYLISIAYDFDNLTLRFGLLLLVFMASVVISRLLLLNRYTSQIISI